MNATPRPGAWTAPSFRTFAPPNISAGDAIEQFKAAMQAAGIEPPELIEPTGDKPKRFSTNGKTKDDGGWYVFHLDNIPAGAFGDFRTGIDETWCADIGRRLTAGEEAEHRRRMEAIKQAREIEQARRQAEAGNKARALLAAGQPATASNPYLRRKGIDQAPTAAVVAPVATISAILGYHPQAKGTPLQGEILVLPITKDGELTGAELIDGEGRKAAIAGSVKSGACWQPEPIPPGAAVVAIAEGCADTLTVKAATGWPALAALSAGNLEAIAKQARRDHPGAEIVILADLTRDTREPDPHAIRAAEAVGGRLAVPDLKPEEGTDFNDLAAVRGLEAVRAALMGADRPRFDWAEPQPLAFTAPAEPYPLGALPSTIRDAVAEYAAEAAVWEAKRTGAKDAIRQAAKQGKPATLPEAALRDLERNKPRSPKVPRLLFEDATPEALAYRLATGWPSAGIMSGEAGTVLGGHGMGKDSIVRNLSLLNTLWDGGTLTVDRKTAESFTLRGARLTVSLLIQESTLRSFFDRSDGLARGTGFFARFLLAWPASTQGSRFFAEAPASWPALELFNRRLSDILEIPPSFDESGVLRPTLLQFTAEAKAAWIAYHDAIEAELRSGGELFDVRDVASKSADNAARLAALFTLFETGAAEIDAETFEGAARLAAWHLNESRRFFGELAQAAELADAARLDDWLLTYLRREGAGSVPKNYVRQHGPIREGYRLDAALKELDDLDRLRLFKEGRRTLIDVNPALLEPTV